MNFKIPNQHFKSDNISAKSRILYNQGFSYFRILIFHLLCILCYSEFTDEPFTNFITWNYKLNIQKQCVYWLFGRRTILSLLLSLFYSWVVLIIAASQLLEDFDAVIFHDPTWYKPWSNRSFLVPGKRSPHQRYIFLNKEPPGYHTYLKKWDESAGFFNWTISPFHTNGTRTS